MKWLCAFFLCFSAHAFCQDAISGKIVSDKGEPLPGASVFISNTKTGTNTNTSGEFILSHLPAGSTRLTVTFVGYETETVEIAANMRAKRYVIHLQPQSGELKAVVVARYDKRGWKKWGSVFTDAFIGTSAFAKHCVLINKEAIHFVYNDKLKRLFAFADEPLQIENSALGYRIVVTLQDFRYEVATGVVDYLIYSLFSEIKGTEEAEAQWKRNREQAYAYSLLHFMRAVYNQNFKNEGFQVRLIESAPNAEKQRVQQLYRDQYAILKKNLSDSSDETSVNHKIEKLFDSDSLIYYKKILAGEDKTAVMNFNLQSFKDIAHQTDSNTVLLHFNQYLQVTYIKAREPEEYLAYKNKMYLERHLISKADLQEMTRLYPGTELYLTQGIPIEISENGYFNNIDLFMNGFWGWWEKIATTLPYDYEP